MGKKRQEPEPVAKDDTTKTVVNAGKRSRADWGQLFLTELRASGNVRQACEAAGIRRTAAYDYRDDEPAFRAAWDEAMEDACDELEKIARERASRMSDTLLIFLLKAHRPEKYRERFDHQHSGKGGGPIVLNITEEIVTRAAVTDTDASAVLPPPGASSIPPQ